MLQRKVCIVTGASRGIGKAIAMGYAAQSARVIVAARTEVERARFPGTIYATAKETLAAGGAALAVHCDVTDDQQVQALVTTYGRIDGPHEQCWHSPRPLH